MKISADIFSSKQMGRMAQSAAAFVLGLLAIAAPGCGKVGDPLPPIPRAPLIIDELSVAQQGASMVLSIPISRTARSPKLQRIDVYRLIESADDPLGLPQDAFSTRATIINSVEGNEIPLSRSITTVEDA